MSTDAEFLGLVEAGSPGRFTFVVQDHLAAHADGHLYGGTALAVSITAAELVSERRALWMTTQFVATAPTQTTISVHAEVLAPGRRTNQVRVTGTDEGGRTMFASLGATGRYKPGGLDGTFERPPSVSAPGDSERWANPVVGLARAAGFEAQLPNLSPDSGFGAAIEFRGPQLHEHPDPGPGRMCLWLRRRDGVPVTAALAAFMADFVPLSVAAACGAKAGGVSLDNTIRIGAVEPTEWVLLDLRPHLAVGGYGHGAVQMWNEEGQLLATASQTASMFDLTLDRLGALQR